MGTYKHIGHLRSARLIGRDVASFYMLQGETQKAAAFLGDALRTFEQDGWRELAAQTQLELAECYRTAADARKLLCTCAVLSATPEIDTLIRWRHFDEMVRGLGALDRPLVVPFGQHPLLFRSFSYLLTVYVLGNVIRIKSVTLKNEGPVMQDGTIEIEVAVDSGFPREVLCTEVRIALEQQRKGCGMGRRTLTDKDLRPHNARVQPIHIQRHLDYKQDKQLEVASVVCKNVPLKRKESGGAATSSSAQSDFSVYAEVTPLVRNLFTRVVPKICKDIRLT